MALDEPIDLDQLPQREESPYPALSHSLNLRGANSPASIALRNRNMADREHIAGQNFELRAQQQELRKVHELASIAKERMRIEDSMEKHRQTMQAVSQVKALAHDDPDFESKFAQIGHDNPMAMSDPLIQKALSHRYQTQQTQQTYKNQIAIHAEEEAARERAVIGHAELSSGIAMPYKDDGRPDFVAHAKAVAEAKANSPETEMTENERITHEERGRALTPEQRIAQTAAANIAASDAAIVNHVNMAQGTPGKEKDDPFVGDTNGTFYNITYTTPKGENITRVMPVATYDAIAARHQSRQPAATPKNFTPLAGAPPTLPAIPDDHAAYLRANPDKAASFDATYGKGAAADILGAQ